MHWTSTMARYRWVRTGDINGVVGLLLDNIATLVLLFGMITTVTVQNRFEGRFVLERIIPGTVAGVVVGAAIYTFLAVRLARRGGGASVTAMPVGLDTPSVFVMALLVLLPTLREAEQRGMERHTASAFAWHVGLMTTVMLGLFKMVCAPLGNAVRSWLPRAGMLGSLAAVSLAVIAFFPLSREVAAVPLVGMPALAVILVVFMSSRGTRGPFPGALVAVLVGFAIFIVAFALGKVLHQPLLPMMEIRLYERGNSQLPQEIWRWEWWSAVWTAALIKLPVVLPLGLATLVGGVQCTESAAATGDEYDCRSILFTQGLATTVAGLCGGVVQITPYFGHPAYKQMGARTMYLPLVAVLLAVAAYFGWFVSALESLPSAVLFPIIVYLGLQTIAHSFQTTPGRDYAAMALAALPVLAYVTIVPINQALGNRPPHPSAATLVQTLRCLSNGFIITSLLWGSALAWLLGGRPVRAGLLMLVAAGCSLFGVIHSPLPDAPLAWPTEVMAQLPSDIRIQTQSPYHWAAAYVLTAIVLFVSALLPAKRKTDVEKPETVGSPAMASVEA
jgi:AGZA family xanthine/uracil permease-like MFS transporter